MANTVNVKLPWELIEEILLRVPPKSLARFKIVSKQWNALFHDKTFLNSHKATFRFMLATESKIYSVSVDPKIVVSELALDIPGLVSNKLEYLVDCNDFLLCAMKNRVAVLNPWLPQTARWIEVEQHFLLDSIGYDHTRNKEERVYKILASYPNKLDPAYVSWKIHDFASDAWKDHADNATTASPSLKRGHDELLYPSSVSLNGSLFWVASYSDKKIDSLFHLFKFDFSTEKFSTFCNLPCGKNHLGDVIVLTVFKGDRFSLLKQCHLTKKIDIWVTKKEIDHLCGRDVKWMNFMQVSIPNFLNSKPSYFIEDRKLFICSCDETGRAWIYVVKENQLISKVRLDFVADLWPLHCTYFPSLVPVPLPRGKREEAELQL